MTDDVYFEDGGANGVPQNISDLTFNEQIEFISLWFRSHFEDPQNEMPYAEKDEPYNYRYPWGGPYDAREEIENAFAGLASEAAINAVVEVMEQEAPFEWAPTSNHPKRRALEDEAFSESNYDAKLATLEDIQQRLENGVVPSFDDALVRENRDVLRRKLAELREILTQDSSKHGGMGHNNPPSELALTIEIRVEANQEVENIDTEIAKDAPDVRAVISSISVLKKIVVGGVTLIAGGFLAAAGTDIYASVADGTALRAIESVVKAALKWADAVTLPYKM